MTARKGSSSGIEWCFYHPVFRGVTEMTSTNFFKEYFCFSRHRFLTPLKSFTFPSFHSQKWETGYLLNHKGFDCGKNFVTVISRLPRKSRLKHFDPRGLALRDCVFHIWPSRNSSPAGSGSARLHFHGHRLSGRINISPPRMRPAQCFTVEHER